MEEMKQNSCMQPPFVSAIIAAAGSSNRMQGIDKQYLEIRGVPVVVRAALAFEMNPLISEIVVVCRQMELPVFTGLFKNFKKVTQIVPGGANRQDSVFAGVAKTNPRAEYYAIHDGARPFVDQQTIARCIENAIQSKATTAAVKVKDTIKVVKENLVVSTPQRDTLYQVQTPQVFAASLYQVAMQQAQQQQRIYTDDCQLIESMHHQVTITQGDYRNIKITTQDDMYIAQYLGAMLDESRKDDENWSWL